MGEYKRVIQGTRSRKQLVAVKKTGHPAAFRKIRCPHCNVGYAIENNLTGSYQCGRCGAEFKRQAM